jgi:hypothetical protein
MQESENYAYGFVCVKENNYLARSFKVSRVSLDELMRRNVLHGFSCRHCFSAKRELC